MSRERGREKQRKQQRWFESQVIRPRCQKIPPKSWAGLVWTGLRKLHVEHVENQDLSVKKTIVTSFWTKKSHLQRSTAIIGQFSNLDDTFFWMLVMFFFTYPGLVSYSPHYSRVAVMQYSIFLRRTSCVTKPNKAGRGDQMILKKRRALHIYSLNSRLFSNLI